MRGVLLIASLLMLAACSDPTTDTDRAASSIAPQDVPLIEDSQTGRWYSLAQVESGREHYGRFCAACHGAEAEATPDWKTPDRFGNYPPPPLNGSAHAWHHPLSVLDQVIRDGTGDLGGNMPPWGHALDAQERLALIAGFQAYWSDETYIWLERERASRP